MNSTAVHQYRRSALNLSSPSITSSVSFTSPTVVSTTRTVLSSSTKRIYFCLFNIKNHCVCHCTVVVDEEIDHERLLTLLDVLRRDSIFVQFLISDDGIETFVIYFVYFTFIFFV